MAMVLLRRGRSISTDNIAGPQTGEARVPDRTDAACTGQADNHFLFDGVSELNRKECTSLGVVVHEFPPFKGGVATFTEDLCRLAARRWPVTVFLTGFVQQPLQYDENIRVVALGDHADPETVFQALEEMGITHVLFNHILCAPLPLILKCRRAGIPMWTNIHGAYVNTRGKVRFGIKRWVFHQLVFRLQCGAVANSHFTRSSFFRKLPGVPMPIIHPGVWQDRYVPVLETRRRSGVVALGRLVRRKGFDILLEAFQKVRSDTLTVIGNGPDLEFLKSKAAELRIASRVRFVTGLTHEEDLRELASHRVFGLLPKLLPGGDAEGFGIVFIEAAAAGLPVVAGRSGGVLDAVNDGVNGFLVDPGNPQEAADRLIQLLTDDTLCEQMSRASLKWAEKFDWNRRDPEKEFGFLLKQPGS